MILPLILHPEVFQEIETARKWYDQIAFGLADEFTRCLVATLDRIHRNPSMYAVVESTFRRAGLRRFPYQLFYRIGREQVFVLGLYHSHADPQTAISRVAGRDPRQ
jgi:hypothetical protein